MSDDQVAVQPSLVHGVGIVDARGPECICGKDFPYTSGGWLPFNAHLAEATAALLTREALLRALADLTDAVLYEWGTGVRFSERINAPLLEAGRVLSATIPARSVGP